jgi:branched-chain amino acid transport system ATP-binding protein
MLLIENLQVHYGRLTALRGVSIAVNAGEIVGLIGPNGAGKTTTLGAVSGLVPITAGRIEFEGRSIVGNTPERIVRGGIALVPEGRHIFGSLTVRENMRLAAAIGGDRSTIEAEIERVLEKFPVLAKYYDFGAGTLSGGEQQQLAIARALLSRPRLLLLDEPSLGLAPRIVERVFDTLTELHSEGVTILLVEQVARRTVKFAHRTYILRNGAIAKTGTREELLNTADLESAYLGL